MPLELHAEIATRTAAEGKGINQCIADMLGEMVRYGFILRFAYVPEIRFGNILSCELFMTIFQGLCLKMT
ncbi:hypothetical protein [Desulfoluna butyratoxydans]|uniref:hypothetical protein n=1 Tax=Desulfoluna butyratoxydans TaxID=231438 RepID=UPI001FEC4B19|nr:hypothetical protein [Desulfoluna butyratoxydans]